MYKLIQTKVALDLHKRAKARAKREGITLAAYLRRLLIHDDERAGKRP